jgi:hypothetical protein
VQSPSWHCIDVDGETYFWTTYPSQQRVGDGPRQPIEYVNVSRKPNTPGIGACHPPGTVITEQHAIDLVRLAKAEGRDLR